MGRVRGRHTRVFRVMCAALAAGALYGGTVVHAAPTGGEEKHASTLDSNARRWSGIDGSRYGDTIRKTPRITYPDAGIAPQTSCDVTGDQHTDLVFLSARTQELFVLPYIPKGTT